MSLNPFEMALGKVFFPISLRIHHRISNHFFLAIFRQHCLIPRKDSRSPLSHGEQLRENSSESANLVALPGGYRSKLHFAPRPIMRFRRRSPSRQR